MKYKKSSPSKKNGGGQRKALSGRSKPVAKARQAKEVAPLKKTRKTSRLSKVAFIHTEAPQEVSQSKFYTGPEPQTQTYQAPSQELPARYFEDKIVAQVRDPWWIYTYWEVKGDTIENIKNRTGSRFDGARLALRVYDVSFVNFNGKNANKHFDIDVHSEVSNWYIDVGEAGRSWCIDVGFRLPDGSFITIARSNVITTPLDGPSWITDEEWMIPDDKFARLYGMGFGFGVSSPGRKGWVEKLRMPISSPGLFSMTSPIRKRRQEKGPRGFWLVVETELIVRGATEPNAKVTVDGHPIQLNPDGTFFLRFPLPDGLRTVPVEAQSFDGVEHRAITPVVSKETR